MPTTALDPVHVPAPPCGEGAARALSQRVAALRAALESVRSCLRAEDVLHPPVAGALRELEGLARDVRALVDWSLPPAVHPQNCTLEEIGRSALDGLAPAARGALNVTVEAPSARVLVDGLLASRSLARVVEHGLARGAGNATLLVVPRGAGLCATVTFQGADVGADSLSALLAEALARRDLARLGARVRFETEASRVVVEFGPKAEDAR
ncbi:MAG: hypothetical protein JNK02_10080 [Planctomycetes bacterium]|nr:hypothetical protein [Planctomycetota bacterium]